MSDRAGKNVRYNSPPRVVADPVRGVWRPGSSRLNRRNIIFPRATQNIINAGSRAAAAAGSVYLIPLEFMPKNEYREPPANLQRNRRHEPAYVRANRAAARAAAAAEEEAAAAAAAAAAPAAAAPAAAAPAAAALAAPALAALAPMAPAAAALAAVEEEAVEENNNNNNFIIRQVKRSRPGNASRKGRKGRKNRKSRKSRH